MHDWSTRFFFNWSLRSKGGAFILRLLSAGRSVLILCLSSWLACGVGGLPQRWCFLYVRANNSRVRLYVIFARPYARYVSLSVSTASYAVFFFVSYARYYRAFSYTDVCELRSNNRQNVVAENL